MRVLAVLPLVLFAACQAPPTEMTEADVAAIEALPIDFQATLAAGDWEGWSELWTEDAVYMPPGHHAEHGRRAIKGIVDVLRRPPPSDFTVTLEAVEGFGKWAWARGTYSYSLSAFENLPRFIEGGTLLWVLEKQPDGTWLIDSASHNSDMPPPMPPPGV